jgi:hypothetical protein
MTTPTVAPIETREWTTVEDPRSFVFYVVAKIGGHHYQLAVAKRQSPLGKNPVHKSQVTRACRRLINIFSDPINRVAIQGELALAADLYGREQDNGWFSPPRTEFPDTHRFSPSFSELLKGRAWDRRIREFPFISTCLLLGISYDIWTSSFTPAQTEPLGLVYRETVVDYGAVVIDITELTNVRYGIIAFPIRLQYDVPHDIPHPLLMGFPMDDPPRVTVLVDDQPRRPLSGAEYMIKFGYGSDENIAKLDKSQVVDIAALEG